MAFARAVWLMLPRPLQPSTGYQPRRAGPDHDLLYRIIQDHLEDFLSRARESGRPVPEFVEQEFRSYLTCGIPEHGFTWYRCEDCDHSLVLPFSCKGRGRFALHAAFAACSSCGGRRMNQLAANLVDRVIPTVPTRHWVISFPMRVRFLLAWRPKLRNEVMAAFFDVILGWYRSRVARQGHPSGRGGAVGAWHLAGSSLNCNPHIHSILLDGVYTQDEEGGLVFHPAQRPTRRVMKQLVTEIRERVEAVLDRHGLLEHVDLDEEDGQLSMQIDSVQGRGAQKVRMPPLAPPRERGGLWGWDEYFDLHAGQTIHAADRHGLERLVRYIARPPLSRERLSELSDGRLCLRLKRVWDDGTSCFVFSPLQLRVHPAAQVLARLSSIVPQPRHNLTHYFGVLAPHASWRAHVVPEQETSRGPRRTSPPERRSSWIPWAELMRRTWGIDPLRCRECGGAMLLRAIVRTKETALKLLDEVLHYPCRLELPQPARAGPAELSW